MTRTDAVLATAYIFQGYAPRKNKTLAYIQDLKQHAGSIPSNTEPKECIIQARINIAVNMLECTARMRGEL